MSYFISTTPECDRRIVLIWVCRSSRDRVIMRELNSCYLIYNFHDDDTKQKYSRRIFCDRWLIAIYA